jgi:hypothetical protein
MKKPTPDEGLANSESVNGFGQGVKTSDKLVNPSELFNRPSLIPGVEYPINKQKEQLLDAAYRKGYADARRIYREPDTLLRYMRNEVERIRKEEIL